MSLIKQACVVLLLLVTPVVAQGTAKEHLSKAVHEANGLVEKLARLQEQAGLAVRHARAANEAAHDSGESGIEAAAVDLETQAAALQAAMQQMQAALVDARQAAAKLAPATIAAELHAARRDFEAAGKRRKLPDVEAAYKAVANGLRKPLFTGNEEARRLLAHAEFRHADAIRGRALLQLRKGGSDRQAERTLLASAKQFEKVLEHDDVPQIAEGSSLHATVLHRVISIHGSFVERYVRLSRDPRVRGREKKIVQRAREHREKAETLFEELRRIHPEAVNDKGALVVETVRQEMADIFK